MNFVNDDAPELVDRLVVGHLVYDRVRLFDRGDEHVILICASCRTISARKATYRSFRKLVVSAKRIILFRDEELLV